MDIVPGEQSFFHGNERNGTNDLKKVGLSPAQGLGVVPRERSFFCTGTKRTKRKKQLKKVRNTLSSRVIWNKDVITRERSFFHGYEHTELNNRFKKIGTCPAPTDRDCTMFPQMLESIYFLTNNSENSIKNIYSSTFNKFDVFHNISQLTNHTSN